MLSLPKRVIKIRGPISGVKIISAGNVAEPEASEATTDPSDGTATNGSPPTVEYLHITPDEFQAELTASYQRGFDEGKVEGYQEAEAHLGTLIANVDTILKTLEEEREKLLRDHEKALLDLVFKMTEKIVGALSEAQQNLIEKTLRELLTNLAIEGKIRIFIHPDDQKALQEMMPQLQKSIPDMEDLRIITDAGISRGGCIIDGSNAKLDARLETRLAEMQRQLIKIATAVEKSQSKE